VKAALYTGSSEALTVEDVQPLAPGPRDVIVQVEAAGVCHSDLGILRHAPPGFPTAVLGHEAAGRIVEVGTEVRTLQQGDRVVSTIIASCGRCYFCTRGEVYLCADPDNVAFRPRHKLASGDVAVAFAGLGAFAERIIGDEGSFVKVDTDLPAEQLALLGCGLSTGLGAALHTGGVTFGDSVVVIGTGGVGMAAVQGARIAGAGRIIAVDLVEMKRTHALTLGATDEIDPSAGDAVEAVRELTGGLGADVVIEAVGAEPTITQGNAMLRRGGTLVLVGMPRAGTTVTIDPIDVGWGGKRIVGCVFGNTHAQRDIPRYVQLAERGLLDLDAMVSRTLPLDEINDAFSALESGEVIRSVIR
jgi:S-(hydroxymethyl)glutathione dehydrogenase / alcohol dehydrogenase